MSDIGGAPQYIEFMASLPPLQSAITLDGHGDGARIKLDIPRSDTGAVLLLQAYAVERPLRVRIEIVAGNGRGNADKRREPYI